MITINAMICRYCILRGVRKKVYTIYVTAEDSERTKVTASPIDIADSSFLETPIKGQIPKKRVSTKLFIIAADKNSNIKFKTPPP